MWLTYIKTENWTRVYLNGIPGFEIGRIWVERDSENGCRVVCNRASTQIFRTHIEVSDEVNSKMLPFGYDLAMMTFDELVWTARKPDFD